MKSIRHFFIVILIFVLVQISLPLFAQSFAWHSQKNPQWSGNRLGSTSYTNSDCTIGNYGCAMSCVAMLLQQESTDATAVTPASLNTYLTNKQGGYQYVNGYALIDWSVAAEMDGSSGLTYYGPNDVKNNWSYLDTQLAAGRKVIVKVDSNPSTAALNQHWVLVYEKNGPSGQPSSYSINDPLPETFPNPQRTLAKYYDPIYNNTFFQSRVYAGNFSTSGGSISMVSGYPISVLPSRTNPSTAYFLPVECQNTVPAEGDKNLTIYFRIMNSGSSSITLNNFGVEAKADNSSGAPVFYCNYNQSITLSPGQQATFNKRDIITDQWNSGGSRNFYFHVTYQVNGVWTPIPGSSSETNLRLYPLPSISPNTSNSWLMKSPSNSAIYYYQNGYKWQMSGESAANGLVPSWQTTYYVYPTATINSLSVPPTPSNNSTQPMMCGRNFVFKNPSTNYIYILEPEPGYSSPLYRRHFDSEVAWDSYGYSSGTLSQVPVMLTTSQYNWVTSQWGQGSTIYPPSFNVNISSNPSGASIYVGGSNSGYTTPHTFSMAQGSSATYSVQMAGYTWSPTSFPVNNIQSVVNQNFVGTPLTHSVNITSNPSGASIYVGGSSSGYTTPHTFTMVQGSSATYSVQMTGYTWSPTSFPVNNIQANVNQNFVGTIQTFSVSITSNPSNADIYLGGTDSGYNTPHNFIMNYNSSSVYTVQMSGYTWSPTSFAVNNIQANASQNFTGTLSVPGTAVLSSPANGASGLAYTAQTLTWTYGTGNTPTGYKVYFGTSNPPSSLVTTQSETSYITGALSTSTTYYWKIVSYNVAGDAPGSPVWSFTTAATSTYTVEITSSPVAAAIYVEGANSSYTTPHTFSMAQGTSATYTVQLTGYSWVPASFDVNSISANTNQNFTGTLSVPGAAILSTPSNGETGLAYTGQALTWAAGVGNEPTGYKVYFGTSNPPATLLATQGSTSCPTGVLSQLTLYYWKVVAYNAAGDAPSSSVWSFTTSAQATLPSLSSFIINNGSESTTSASVILNNVSTNATHYIASETAGFVGANWQTYSAAPAFVLSSGPGLKTVYLKVKNTNGESGVLSDQITLLQAGNCTIFGHVEVSGGTNLDPTSVVISVGGITTHPNTNGDFTVTSIPVGSHTVTATLEHCQTVSINNVVLTTGQTTNVGTMMMIQNPPLWTPIVGNQYSAIGFFSVYVDETLFSGNTGSNGYNLIGAFNSAGECLGVGTWQTNLFYLDILNNTQGSSVYFKIYDGNTDEVLDCAETLVFTDNELYGAPESPVNLHVTTSISISYNLVAGWNWVSIPMSFSNPLLANVFSALGSSVQTVKTQTQSAIRAANGTWYGTLTSINGLSSYLIQMSSAETLVLAGMPISLESTLGLVANWNWPAYLPTTSGIAVPAAFTSLVPNISIVKTQSQSKIYSSSSNQWYGSLSSVNPGQGIKVQMATADNLVYPGSRLDDYSQPYALESNGYSDNMILHAQLLDGSMNSLNLNECDVFIIDNEGCIRSKGTQIPVGGIQFFYFTIGGSSGDVNLIPCLRNRNTGQEYYSTPIEFVADSIVGSYDSPTQLTFNIQTQVIDDEQFGGALQAHVVPNPVHNSAKIHLSNMSKNNEDISICIYDMRGRKIKQYQGIKQTEIDLPSDLSSGIYFVTVTCAMQKYTTKFIKIK